MPVDKFGRMSDTKTKDTGVSLTYINNNYVRSDGGTPLKGSLDIKGNTIYNVADPVNPQDVATREYVDSGGKQLIAVSTYYCGDLIKGEYQFPFGGNTCKFSGFLMPQPGRIKRIDMRFIGDIKSIPEGVTGEIRKKIIKEILLEVENEELDLKDRDDFKTMIKILYLRGNLFSIVLFENLDYLGVPVGSILSTFKCHDTMVDDDVNTLLRNCRFDNDLTNYPLARGEVINIRTEIERNVRSDWSFLFTFLIELDPL